MSQNWVSRHMAINREPSCLVKMSQSVGVPRSGWSKSTLIDPGSVNAFDTPLWVLLPRARMSVRFLMAFAAGFGSFANVNNPK